MRVTILGAGIAGLTCALELHERGAVVEVLERAPQLAGAGCSWFAGGMLAPWCERESSPALIAELGTESLSWWRDHFAGTAQEGTLVVAHARDTGELAQFARRTAHFENVSADTLAALEPELAGRFSQGLHFPEEGHLDPRAALGALLARLGELGVPIQFGCGAAVPRPGRVLLDCRGLAARAELSDLRGVKGEMLLLRLPELQLTRPVRLLHPRWPLYVVPRGEGLFMVGATMLESEDGARISARSMLELLSAAYALHPAFGEAQVIEIGVGVRAAFPDNLPRLRHVGGVLHVNGLYRHGFLLAPALARRAAGVLLEGRHYAEVMDEDPGQRRLA
ncbi:MAG: FAD-dependent oxidoreductase [Gammaproteobacteria bacterium]|nr:FAD-dependent oxidoreductase [Gammaproteobacteria bacterium]